MIISSVKLRRGRSLAALLALQLMAFVPGASSADTKERDATAASVSPDGKWEFRLGESGEEEDQQVFVIAKRNSQEISVTLTEEALSPLPEKAKVVWAPDSKRLAFNYQPGLRDSAVQFFQLDGDEWRELAPPHSNDAIDAPVERSMAAQRKKLKLPSTKEGRPISDGYEVRRWIDAATVLLYVFSHETFEIKKELEQVGDACLVTLKFNKDGQWKIARTRLLPDKGNAGLNTDEREELARMARESEEEN